MMTDLIIVSVAGPCYEKNSAGRDKLKQEIF